MAERAVAFAKIILSGETILAARDVEQFYSGHRRILESLVALFRLPANSLLSAEMTPRFTVKKRRLHVRKKEYAPSLRPMPSV